MTSPTIAPPPRATANPAPPRRPGSVRRTSSIDVSWGEGSDDCGFFGASMRPRQFHGRARDVLTPQDGGAPTVLAAALMEADIAPDKTILAITATPAPPRLGKLVGERGGNHLRQVVAELMPELLTEGDPLYLLLDDISGVSLISNWAWSLWQSTTVSERIAALPPDQRAGLLPPVDICWGLKAGNSAHDASRAGAFREQADGGTLVNPADPAGWHEFPVIAGVSMRRARRIDVWREGGLLHIDSAFQDSAPRPPEDRGGARAALHEYRLSATADAASGTLLSLDADPRILPFGECPGAVANARALVGVKLADIRGQVLARLRGTAGCTHLNDALRALAEVPHLARLLA